jgi:hypothetical protein
MTGSQSWHLLPPDLVELQIGQVDLLMAMYPDDIILEETGKRTVDALRDGNGQELKSNVGVLLNLPIPTVDETTDPKTLRLDLVVPFTYEGDEKPEEPPQVKVRVQQPPWMSRTETSQLMLGIPEDEDLLGIIEHVKEAAASFLADSEKELAAASITTKTSGPLVRVWFYFPSISTRSKRDDFIVYAPSYQLTGFLYAGKPGLLCVEGGSQDIDDYMKFIKTESWGDIPSHHKKVSERHREICKQRVFLDMTEITDTVGERHGQRANRGDMKAIEEWLVERGLGDAFTKVLM